MKYDVNNKLLFVIDSPPAGNWETKLPLQRFQPDYVLGTKVPLHARPTGKCLQIAVMNHLKTLPSWCVQMMLAVAHLSPLGQFLQLCLAALQLLLQLCSLPLTAVIHHLQLLQLHLQTVTLQDTQLQSSDSSSMKKQHVCIAKHVTLLQKYKLNM